jgi:hypothetical protein
MTHQALKLVQRRRRIFHKYKNNSHPAYITAASTARSAIIAAKRNFETKLADKIKEDKKSSTHMLVAGAEPKHRLPLWKVRTAN